MTYYPVIIPTCNRYGHLRACVESLAACTHADKTELVISLDYPPSEKYVEGWGKIKEYLPTITGFRKVTTFVQEKNLGVGENGNFSFLVNYVSAHYDAWISTEDDNVFSPCFLDYMDKGLEMYRDDESVLSINAFFYNENIPFDYRDSTIVKSIYLFSAWGVGMWGDRAYKVKSFIGSNFRKVICGSKCNLIKMYHYMPEFKHLLTWPDSLVNSACDLTYSIFSIEPSQIFWCKFFSLL